MVIFSYLCITSSCATLQPATAVRNSSLEDYKYIYIAPTSNLTSSSGHMYGNNKYTYGSSQTKSINPSDIIAGYLLKKGFIKLPDIKPEYSRETIIVNYGESGRRELLFGYTIEVTIQFLDAKTHTIICSSTAEGMGSTETDDIRIAINRCLDELFPAEIAAPKAISLDAYNSRSQFDKHKN